MEPERDYKAGNVQDNAAHIMIIMHDFSLGGTEIIALKLAREWVKLGRRVTLLCGSESGPLRGSVASDVVVLRVGAEIRRGFLSKLRLNRAVTGPINMASPDLIFLPGNFHLGLASGVKRLHGGPLIVAKISNPVARYGRIPILRWFKRYRYRTKSECADWLVAMSSGLKTEVNEITGHDRISMIFDPNCHGSAATCSKVYDCKAQKTLQLTAIGRLVPQKDFALAIRVLHAILKIRPAHLHIVGDGPNRNALKELSMKLGVSAQITMHGHLTSVTSILASSDILLITSRYEGGPAVAVEALEQGVPIITTDCSHFLTDLVTNPSYGAIIKSRAPEDLANAVINYITIDHEKFIPEIVTRPYTTNKLAESYLHLFDGLMLRGIKNS
jgi:glycosyltransferase involved in cell wall biosynthesis